jgi:uncharacterized membrane protein YccC
MRARRILYTAIGMAVSAFVGFAIGAHPVVMVFAGAFWGFTGALLVALGSDAGRVGVVSIILLVVTSSTPKSVDEAASAALLIFSGGLLQLLIAVAAWPLQRYKPERTALALAYNEIGRAARERPPTTAPPPVTTSMTDLHLMLYGLRRRESMAIQSLRVLAELAERVRLDILSLAGLREQLPQGELRTRTRELLDMAAEATDDIADALRDETTPAHAFPVLADYEAKVTALEAAETESVSTGETADPFLGQLAIARLRSLGGALRAATRNAALAGGQGEVRTIQADAELPTTLRTDSARATLRANMTFSSVSFRHAVRCAVCIALAVGIEYGFQISHGYWIPMTVAIVLKPDFGGTLSFGLLRILGTIAGLLLTTIVAHYLMNDVWERIFLVALFCYGFRTLTPVHYGIAVTLITAMVVILLSFRGEAPTETVWIRLINTCIGSGLALIAYGVWPTWERHQVRPTLATMLDSYRRYFTALLFGSVQARADARVAARLARSNAIDSLTRLEAEPWKDQALVELSERVFANANRLVRAIMELDAVLRDPALVPIDPSLRQFVRKVDDAIAQLAHGLRDQYPVTIPSDLRATRQALARDLDIGIAAATDPNVRASLAALKYASDRITDPVNTLAHVLREPASGTTPDSPVAAAATMTSRTP